MKNRYEGLLVLNVKGNEDGAKEVIERLEGEFKKEGAKVEQVQKMDRRQFTYVAGRSRQRLLREFHLQRRATAIDKLRAQFTLDEDVYRQHYQKLPAKKVEKPGARRGRESRRLTALPEPKATYGQPQQSHAHRESHPGSRDQVHAERHRDRGHRSGRESQLHDRERREARGSHLHRRRRFGAATRRSSASIARKGVRSSSKAACNSITWDDKQTGQKRSKLKVVGETFNSSARREGGGGVAVSDGEAGERGAKPVRRADPRGKPARRRAKRPADPDLDAPEDDIPF